MSTKIKTVREMWNEYRTQLLPKNAPPIQYQECEKSFYVAAQYMFTQMINISDLENEEDIFKAFDIYQEEFEQFKQKMSNLADVYEKENQ